MSDIKQGFLFRQADIRGQWVQLDESITALWGQHNYPPLIKSLLGDMAAAIVMMASALKFKGSMSIHARGNGPINLLSVETNEQGEFRAVARYQAVPIAYQHLGDLFGEAALAITIEPEKGQAYQGFVPLEGKNIAQCLEQYFAQSEQLPTKFYLFSDISDNNKNNCAAGLMLQAMPSALQSNLQEAVQNASDSDDELNSGAALWQEIIALSHTIKAEELLQLPIEEVLHRLFHEHDIQLFDTHAVSFKCRCSREKSTAALAKLGEAELKQLFTELEELSVDCEYCGQSQKFTALELGL